jgi:trimeric autotransporter adhesin
LASSENGRGASESRAAAPLTPRPGAVAPALRAAPTVRRVAASGAPSLPALPALRPTGGGAAGGAAGAGSPP